MPTKRPTIAMMIVMTVTTAIVMMIRIDVMKSFNIYTIATVLLGKGK
jgi:hypothetical protein